jgi:hypothetical protein
MRALTNTRRWFLTMYGLMFAFLFFFKMASTTYLSGDVWENVSNGRRDVLRNMFAHKRCISSLHVCKCALADLVGNIVDVLATIAGADGIAKADLEADQPKVSSRDRNMQANMLCTGLLPRTMNNSCQYAASHLLERAICRRNAHLPPVVLLFVQARLQT